MASRKPDPTKDDNPAGLPPAVQPATLLDTDQKQVVIKALGGYRMEAENARRSGLNPRDDQMQLNLDMYWNRMDFSTKAKWQAKEVMPEVPQYVDRFAAALKEALVSVPEGFYTVVDPLDKEHDLSDAIKTVTDMWLSRSGRNYNGAALDFSTVFEEQCKLGALTAMCSTVSWKNDVPGGRVAVDAVDPRFFWMDHTGRNLYRFRRVELDKIDLLRMVEMRTPKGAPIFNLDELQAAISAGPTVQGKPDDQQKKEEMTGSGQQIISARRPYVMEEWLATVVNDDGDLVQGEHSLYNVINDKFLIRGPEEIPFWHGNDWVTYAPTVITPLSPYGRSYMDDFARLAKTYNEMTNLLLDAVHTSALNAFAVVVEALENPEVLSGGIHPNLLLKVDAAFDPAKVLVNIPLGKLDSGAVQVWQGLKSELSEAAGINEIGMGQFAPNSRTSATEINSTQESSSSMLRGFALSAETRWITPTLDNVWKTGLQFTNFKDPRIVAALNPDMAAMFQRRKKEFIKRPYTFQARGISMMIRKKQVFQELTQLMMIIGQNEQMAQAFLQKVDMNKFIGQLFYLSGLDPTKIGYSAREQMINSVTQPLLEAGGPGIGQAPGVAANLNQLATKMGQGG